MFGDLNADDSRVKEVAVQANALGFIMQSDEDFCSPSVQKRVRDKYNLVCSQQLEKSKHVNFYGLVKKVEAGVIDYKALALAAMLIPYLSNRGIQTIESDFDSFIEALKAQSIKYDPTWQMVLKSYIF